MIFGKPLAGKIYNTCGAVKIFVKLGFASFLIDMPKDFYVDYVHEYSANLTTDKFGNYVSMVRGKKNILNVLALNSILRIENPASIFFYTKKGLKILDDFVVLNQSRLVKDIPDLLEFYTPITSIATPITHILFKICIMNICPRLGSRSNFTCQN